MKIAFLNVTGEQEKYFQENLPEHELTFFDSVLDDLHFPKQLDFEIISAFVKSKFTRAVIDNFTNLKLIALRSTGFDNVDIEYAKQKGIIVCNVPAYGSATVAEFTFGLILSVSRKIPKAVTQLKSEGKFDYKNLKGFDLAGKILGVVGTGKIGGNVIKIANAFGMSVLAHDILPNKELERSLGFKYVDLKELLQTSDIVTLHVPATEKTRYLLNLDQLSLMKKTAYLINTARGLIVETKGLIQVLERGQIAGAALDVLEQEVSLGEDEKKLLDMENVLVTPHIAFYTGEAEQTIIKTTLENIRGFISGHPLNTI